MAVYRTSIFCLVFCLIIGASLFSGRATYAQGYDITDEAGEKNVTVLNVSDQEIEEEFSAFDLYIGGDYYGYVFAFFTERAFRFDNIDDVVNLIPLDSDKDPAYLKTLLSGTINEERVIEDIGSVYVDIESFEIEIEFFEEFSPKRDVSALKALPPPESGISFRNELVGAGSASTENGFDSENLTLNHDTLLSFGRTNIVSRGSVSSAAGYEVTDAAVSQEVKAFGQEVVGSVGLLETMGQRFSRSIDFYGFSLKTNERLFFRDEQNQASRVEIFLQSRSRVEVFRDSEASGRTLLSRIMDFGTTVLDTRNFPEGSYNIEIVITDSNGKVNREIRPFSKTDRLIPKGVPEINVSAGIIRDDDLRTTQQGVLFGAYTKRLTDHLQTEGSVLAIQDDILFEAEITTERPYDFFGFAGLNETKLTIGVNDKADLTGIDFSSQFRADKSTFLVSASKAYNRDVSFDQRQGNLISPYLSAREAVNMNYSRPFSTFNKTWRFNLNGQWSRTPTVGIRYRYGPEITIPVYNSRTVTAEFKLQHTETDDDHLTLASMTWRRNKGAFQQNHAISYRGSKDEKAIVANAGMVFDGRQGDYNSFLKNTSVFAGLRLDPALSNADQEATFADIDADYYGKKARISAFFNNNFSTSTGRYGGEFQNTVLWSPKSGFSYSGANISSENAYVSVKLEGVKGEEVALSVNGITKAYGYTGETLIVEIPTYRTSTLTAFTVNDTLAKIKGRGYEVVGYPGNLLHRIFVAQKSFFIMGRLVDLSGKALINARFKEGLNVYYTDEDGYFYFEYLSGDQGSDVLLETQNFICGFALGESDRQGLVNDVSDVVCK